MTTRWVRGVVRAKALGHRRLGRGGARTLAGAPSLEEAVVALSETPYGHDVHVGQDLAQAQRAVYDSLLWNLRVLAGWLPPDGAESLRTLAGWFEVANVDALLAQLDGAAAVPPYRLGTLGTAWSQLATASSVGEVRERLGRSAWGDPGGDRRWQIQLGMRLAWARRVAGRVPQGQELAVEAVALMLAREAVGRRRPLPDPLRETAARLVGESAASVGSLPELVATLPSRVAALQDVLTPADLWLAETRWWRRLEEQSFTLARSAGFEAPPVLGAVGLLAVDAWRVRAALALAGRHAPREVLDALA